MAETVISGVICNIVAIIMVGIGIFQLKSEEPVGFYSGEKPPKKEQLSDVRAWNKKHGIMWVIYGCCIEASWACSALMGDSEYAAIPLTAGMLAPVGFMIIYHHRLIKKYFIK